MIIWPAGALYLAAAVLSVVALTRTFKLTESKEHPGLFHFPDPKRIHVGQFCGALAVLLTTIASVIALFGADLPRA